MIDSQVIEKLQSKLDLNEQVVWVGKPKPYAWKKGMAFILFFGTFWSAITSVFVVGMLIPMWFGDPNAEITVNGTPTTYGAMSIWAKLGLTAFLTPFICIGISTLLSPLWTYLHSTGLIYAVTTKRALKKGRFGMKSWRKNELDTPDRADKRSGYSDVFFYCSHYQNHTPVYSGFLNLPTADALAAENALKKLCDDND